MAQANNENLGFSDSASHRSRENTWRGRGIHDASAQTDHDESSRMDFVMTLLRHIGRNVAPGHQTVFDKKVEPDFVKKTGRKPKDRHEVRKAMLENPYFQYWSHLRLYSQETSYYERSRIVDRQLDTLIDKAKTVPAGKKGKNDKGSLKLNPGLVIPPYQKHFDMHWMPGSYYTEFTKDDVAGGAMYDTGGLYITSSGHLGAYNDGAGYAIARYIQSKFPTFKPKRVLDEGCTTGSNTVPLKDAWPQAEVHAVDIGAPVLRTAHARSEALGLAVHYSQQNAENTDFKAGSFDLITSSMFLHETARKAVHNIVKECYRLLSPGGIMVHVEQPPFAWAKSPFDQMTRDWDTHNNNEPFWGTMHDMDLEKVALDAGFKKENITLEMVPLVTPTESDKYALGKGAWFVFVARK